MGNGNRPAPKFRREAVWLALSSDRAQQEIAEDLRIGLSTLIRWLGQEQDACAPSEVPVDLHAELSRLRRENAVLMPERDIQKNRGLLRERNNSMMETFFKTIRSETIWPIASKFRQQAANAVARYIDGYHNPVRRHSSLGSQSPIAFA